MENIVFKQATEIIKMVREKQCSCVDLLEAHLRQVGKYNNKINAIVTLDRERARLQAKEADLAISSGRELGPLHGLPITVKDNYDTEGLTTSKGSSRFMNYIPKKDATVVARLRQAGALVYGKTNLPFLGLDWQCKHPHFGRTNNPWNVSYTSGGSSGGAAAALASGFTSLEFGNDVAGSLRVPAHFCGVCAIRPTEKSVSDRGVSHAPGYPRCIRNLVMNGPMARCVQDLQLALSLIWGPDEHQWQIPPIAFDYAKPVHGLADLKVGWTAELGNIPVNADVKEAIVDLVGKLKKAGCQVTHDAPQTIDFQEAVEMWGHIFGFEFVSHGDPKIRLLTWIFSLGLMRSIYGTGEFAKGFAAGLRMNSKRYFTALSCREKIVALTEAFFSKYDVWLCPVSSTTAFPHQRMGKPLNVDGKKVSYSMAMGMYNCTSALAGNPVVVLPIGRSEEGLPIGVQMQAKRWDDFRLLSIAEHIEKIAGGFQQPPKFNGLSDERA
nr:amidase [uncultured Desulfobulbus sp.]